MNMLLELRRGNITVIPDEHENPNEEVINNEGTTFAPMAVEHRVQ
jgi:hypothetical protein